MIRKRAKPMSPEERRASIVDAVLRLILEKQTVPSTAEMAKAAGVAEGTIYSVFPDKHSIFHAVIEKSVDPTDTVSALAAVHDGAPLRIQLAEAARIMQERLDRTINLVMILRSAATKRPESSLREKRRGFTEADSSITEAIIEIFERSDVPLDMPADRLALTFRTLVFASAHPMFGPDDRLTTDEIVSIVLATAGLREGVH